MATAWLLDLPPAYVVAAAQATPQSRQPESSEPAGNVRAPREGESTADTRRVDGDDQSRGSLAQGQAAAAADPKDSTATARNEPVQRGVWLGMPVVLAFVFVAAVFVVMAMTASRRRRRPPAG